MATPNIVPRADQEGGLGTSAKAWGKLFIENATDGGTAAATVSNLDVDQVALDINANNTSANVIDVVAGALSGGAGLYLNTADGQNDIKVVSSADTADYCTLATTASGATTLTTVDGGATAAHFEIAADGDIILDSAGQIKLEPVAGNNILLDGTVAVDAGVITGATSITSTTFVGNRTIGLSGGTDGAYDGDVVYFGGTTSMTIGTIYHYKSDGTWEVTNANAVATSDGLLAVALGAASDTNGMLLRGMVTLDHDPGAIGDVLFLSAASNGDATATAPSGSADIVRVIGYQVNHASQGEIWFNPDSTYVELA